MSYDNALSFDKNKLDKYLMEVGKAYRKLGGKKMPAEMILIGGASVLINYGFRDTTTDIDALINAASIMKEAINKVGDENGLPENWLNADFMRTKSYSVKLVQYSRYYKTFANVLSVRTISGEYLTAMKLKSGRKYKFDLSDVIGILSWHQSNECPISLEDIKRAAGELYGSWDELPDFSRIFIEELYKNGISEETYARITNQERENRTELVYNGWEDSQAITPRNASDILNLLNGSNDDGEALR